MTNDKSEVISNIVSSLLDGDFPAAKTFITRNYPHTYFEVEKRTGILYL